MLLQCEYDIAIIQTIKWKKKIISGQAHDRTIQNLRTNTQMNGHSIGRVAVDQTENAN